MPTSPRSARRRYGIGHSSQPLPGHDGRNASPAATFRPARHRGRQLRRRKQLLPDGRHGHERFWTRPGDRAECTTPPTASSAAPTPGSARSSTSTGERHRRRAAPRSSNNPAHRRSSSSCRSRPAIATWRNSLETLPRAGRSGATSPARVRCRTAAIVRRTRTTPTAIQWTFLRTRPRGRQTFSLNTEIVDTVPAGGFSFTGTAGTSLTDRRHDRRPEHERHRERVLGDDQLG